MKDRVSLFAAAGYEVADWYNMEVDKEHELSEPIEAIAKLSKAKYPKFDAVRDRTSGKWLCVSRLENVKPGTAMVMRGEGYPRETITQVESHGELGWKTLHFESGRSMNYPPGSEHWLLE